MKPTRRTKDKKKGKIFNGIKEIKENRENQEVNKNTEEAITQTEKKEGKCNNHAITIKL